ncbi:MAG: hypothetical protein NTW26_00280, partial [bacterium]|nr:hypothetical protein [bacterium]
MLFLPRVDVPRSGRDPSTFSTDLDGPAALEALAQPGHSLVEFLCNHAVTKLDRDHDAYFDEAPSATQTAALRADVLNKASSIAMILCGAGRPVTVKLATRHGFCATKGRHKLSFRPFLQGVAIRYTDIPKIIAMQGQQGFWDMSVYKAAEQLMAGINGAKARDAPRVLLPEEPGDVRSHSL